MSVTIKHRDIAALVPGSSTLKVTLIFDRVRGRLLGGQLFGQASAAYRADILIPVIRRGGTVQDLYELDLIYAPPFSPRLDPLLIAAKKAMGQLNNLH
jgi:NADPH-dependent 2,4-dienoyl-CoA reductase/sulfur reductase-like enzyme